MPYIIDGDIKVSEASAVEQYIILRSNFKDLLGKDLKEKAMIKNIVGVLDDIGAAVVGRTIFGASKDNWEAKKPEIFNSIRPKMEQVKDFIGDK